ncbi:cell wall hydrolase [Pseudalkalibacillus caeni]|uniref:LysM peptidoglycan-binding domain-containing protein n=1 Tax=Exobacillus caeni TaxID=2574798 RepID=A0A5R9F7F8_9BACL|nr:cell wall hydrolase [Pseudalkalibacillus caeni]TLS37558.1 LysM peptidoglycan-binding domain-containing protein [Pseudalkalibacillus caeni]
MKKLVLTTISLCTALVFFGSNTEAASDYYVQPGDTLWEISNNYQVPVPAIKKVNHLWNNYLYAGQKLTIPSAISSYEKDLLARLVNAEAKGEPYAGKVAVATVVLNRVDSSDFPNSVHNVVYQKAYGHYAFTPVQNGEINKPASWSSKKAVEEAIAFRGQGQDSLYFYNPRTATSDWITTREVTVTIGKHRFAK